MDFLNAVIQTLGSTLRVSTPLLFAALGGLFSESSGITNIALEGMMAAGAFGAAACTLWLHSPVLGTIGGVIAAVWLAACYAFFVIELKANQIVAGTAMNLFASGFTPFLAKILYDSSTATPSIPMGERFQIAPLILAVLFTGLTWLWINFTPSGLWLRFAGENPEALESAGVSVHRVRWSAVLMSGCLAGLGGASLSIFLSSSFSRNMTAGRGFMALAALIFGKWRPLPTAGACLLFGFFDAIQTQLQGVVLWGTDPVPVQFIQVLPYLFTVIVLAGWVGDSRAPKALGHVK